MAVPIIKPNIVNEITKCPVGSYLLIGSFPQYAYNFNPLILSGYKYSIESVIKETT